MSERHRRRQWGRSSCRRRRQRRPTRASTWLAAAAACRGVQPLLRLLPVRHPGRGRMLSVGADAGAAAAQVRGHGRGGVQDDTRGIHVRGGTAWDPGLQAAAANGGGGARGVPRRRRRIVGGEKLVEEGRGGEGDDTWDRGHNCQVVRKIKLTAFGVGE